jgi:3-oxoadipate enol-lactonase
MAPVDVSFSEVGPADAPVLVLSSSLGADRTMWDDLAGALAGRFRVVTYDHRGHGASPVPEGPSTLADVAGDVVRLLDRLGVERAHFGGLSLGGMVGMWLGVHAPGRVERLVLMCTSAKLGPPEMWADRAATVRAEGTASIAEAVVTRWATDAYRERHPDVVARLEQLVAAQPDAGYASCCAAIEHMDQVADLRRITAPTLVISGAEDPATPSEHQELIAREIPGARLEVLSPAAHLATVEQPGAIAALVRDFLTD